MVNVFYSIVIFYHCLLDEVLEQGVHLIGLGFEVIVVCGLELKRGDESLLEFLEVQAVGFGLHFGLTLCLLISSGSTVPVLYGPSDLGLHIPAFLV